MSSPIKWYLNPELVGAEKGPSFKTVPLLRGLDQNVSFPHVQRNPTAITKMGRCGSPRAMGYNVFVFVQYVFVSMVLICHRDDLYYLRIHWPCFPQSCVPLGSSVPSQGRNRNGEDPRCCSYHCIDAEYLLHPFQASWSYPCSFDEIRASARIVWNCYDCVDIYNHALLPIQVR